MEYHFSNGERRELTLGPRVEVLGLDPEGRVVVRFGISSFPFGLTLCCNATDTGTEDGVVCRGCHGLEDIGMYNPRIVHHVVPTATATERVF